MRSELEQYQNSIKEFNESTRLGFESFIQSNGSDRNKLQLRCTPFTDKKGGYGSFDLDFGLSVYQHQQSKVDELNQQLESEREETIKGYTKISDLRLERDELQKRVDSTLQLVNEMKGKRYPFSAYADQLEQALKGGEDASN